MKNLYVIIVEKRFQNLVIHVDVNPGDRLETCQGDLEPVGLEINKKKGYVIIFKCKKCGAIRKNKAAEDDDMNLIIKLSAGLN